MPILKKITFLALLFFFSSNALGQIDASIVNDNPYTVIYNHLYYLQNDSYEPLRAAISLPDNVEDSVTISIMLKQVLDGKGLFVDLNRVPTDINYFDSIAKQAVYFIDSDEPLIYVEKVDSLWHYSRTTIDAIPGMHKKLFPFGTQFITTFQAPIWQINILGIKLWKWLGLVLFLVASWLAYSVFFRLCKIVFGNILKKRIEMSDEINSALYKLSKLFGLLLAIRLLLYLVPMLQITPRANSLIIKGFNILSIFFIILVLTTVARVAFIFMERAAAKTENTLDDQLLPVLEKVVQIILWAFGIIYILDYMDVNVTALLAGLSIGGLALALAAQDTVKNFFGSIMIFLDKPFQIGDWIHFKGIDGTVEEVGVRATRVRTFGNSITYIPNAMLADNIINNMGLRIFRRFKMEIGITYDTKPEAIDSFVEGIKKILKMHPYIRKDNFEVHLNSFGVSSINILVYSFFQVPSWTEELLGKHEILNAIIKLADRLGVRFAFPTQTVHIEEIPKAGMSTRPFVKSSDELVKGMDEVLSDIETYFNAEHDKRNKSQMQGEE